MRLFESKKISKLNPLTESLVFPTMNNHEALLKNFNANPKKQIRFLLKQISLNSGLELRFEDIENIEIIKEKTDLFPKNIGISATFTDAEASIPKSGILNHKIGKIDYVIWGKKLKLNPR